MPSNSWKVAVGAVIDALDYLALDYFALTLWEVAVDGLKTLASLPMKLLNWFELNRKLAFSKNIMDLVVEGKYFHLLEGETYIIKSIMDESVDVHGEICDFLKIGKFVPAVGYKPYAIKETKIDVYSFKFHPLMTKKSKVASFGGFYQCAFCACNLNPKPAGNHCPRCHNSKLTNIKEIM